MAPAERRWRRTPFVGPVLRRRSDEGLEAFGEWLPRVAARGELDDGVFKTLAAESEVGHDATIGTAFFVYGAARVTVERFLGSAVRTLAEAGTKPGEWPPRVTPELIDELLRWDPPAAVAARVTKADLTLGSTEIPAGTQLVVLMRVVNRDPATFDDPDTFRPDRDPNPHLAFSAGAHFCLGAPLARVEGAVVLEELLGWLGPYGVGRRPTEGAGLPHRPLTRLVVSRR
jgi:cytochrome P450